MKRFLVIAALLLLTLPAGFAQNASGRVRDREPHGRDRDKTEMSQNFERIRLEKVEFLTRRLALTEQEADAFWPVYEACGKALMEVQKTVKEARHALVVKKGETVSDKEMGERLEAYVKARRLETAVLDEYHEKLLTVLPVSKVARLYLAEEQFRKQLTRRMTGHPGVQSPEKGKSRSKRPQTTETCTDAD